jgi:uncharacterized RDD family membrane protein YckC
MHDKQIIETRAALDTPEGVQLTFQLAGPGLRMAAYAADFVIRVLGTIGVGILIAVVFGTLGISGFGLPAFIIASFLAEWAYPALFEWLWNGRTPGKRMFHIRVIKDGGYPIGFYEAILRNFLRAADAPFIFFFGIGLVVMMSTKRLQRLGDLAAGTMVVIDQSERVRFKPRNLQLVPELKRSECRRGFHVSERTLDVICRLFERTGYLSGPRREAIATVLAEPIADRLGFELESMPAQDRGSRFLIRVIKTFSRAEEDRNDEQEAEAMRFLRDAEEQESSVLQTGGTS